MDRTCKHWWELSYTFLRSFGHVHICQKVIIYQGSNEKGLNENPAQTDEANTKENAETSLVCV